jgi:mgtE-like transporter
MKPELYDKNFTEILSSQTVSIIGGIIAGVILASYTNKLLVIPGVLITLPAFLDMRGNISGSMASRLSSGMFLGVIKTKTKKVNTPILRGNIIASLVLAVVISLFLGLVAFAFSWLVSHVLFPKVILIFLVAGIIASLIEIPLAIYMTFYLYRNGYDPNNIFGPFVTSTGDITSVLSLLVALMII